MDLMGAVELTIGLKLAQGREAEVYAWNGNAVLKLYWPGYLGHIAEASALSTLQRSGSTAPRLIGAVEIDGRHGLILERLEGPDMLSLLQRRPWRMLGLARTLAEAQLLIHGVQAPEDLPDLKQVLAARIEAGVESAELRDFSLQVLDPLPAGDRLCHGDFHPGNVLVADSQVSVIDWTNATRGVPEADFARTALLLAHGEPPPDTSRLFRTLLSAGRSVFARAYARNYRRRTEDPLKQVRSWVITHAAARLADGIEEEEPMLIAFLNDARRKAMH